MEEVKRFVPPIEDPSINTDLLADILCWMKDIYDDRKDENERRDIKRIQKAADSISIMRAKKIGMDDMVARLRRNAMALQLIRSMYNDCMYAMRSEIRTLFEASQAEHEEYLKRLETLKSTFAKQCNAERNAKYRSKNK